MQVQLLKQLSESTWIIRWEEKPERYAAMRVHRTLQTWWTDRDGLTSRESVPHPQKGRGTCAWIMRDAGDLLG